MLELGHDERNILRFIERFCNQRAFSPTIEEIRVGAAMKSKDHVHRDLKRLEQLRYVKIERGASRGIVLLRTADGYPIIPGGYRIPILGIIAAGKAIPLPEANAQPIDWVDATRAMLGDSENVFALRVRGNSMIDALVNDGDTIILKRQETAQNRELVAVRLKNDPTNPGTTLKRFYRYKNRVCLQPENPTLKAKYYKPTEVEIQGKVLCVIRKI
ncbi:MAG: transcriptional repressor LexA, partial [Chloroflexota bacterium]